MKKLKNYIGYWGWPNRTDSGIYTRDEIATITRHREKYRITQRDGQVIDVDRIFINNDKRSVLLYICPETKGEV